MRAIALSTLVALLLLADNDPLCGQTRVRAVHLLQGAPAITLYVDSSIVATESLSYGGASALVPIASGVHRLTITGVGAPFEFAVVDTNLALASDSVYTVVLSGSFSLSITRALIVAAPAQPAADSVSTDLRFAHIALGLDSVNVEATPGGGSTVEVSGLLYGRISNVQRVRASDLTIRLSIGIQNPLYRGRGYPSGGGVTTVFLAGSYDGTIQQFAVISMADNDTNEQIPLPSFTVLPNQEGEFRAVHVAAGFGPLDLIRDGAPLDSVPIDYRFAARLRADLLGRTRFRVSRSGEGSAAALTSIDVDVPADSTTTLVLLPSDGASHGPASALLRRESGLRSEAKHSLLRLLHASPDIGAITVSISSIDSLLFDIPELSYGGSHGFEAIPSGEFALAFQTARGTYRFSGGYLGDGLLTAIISGRESDSTLAVNVLVENNPSEQEPMIFLAKSLAGGLPRSAQTSIATATLSPHPVRDRALLAFHAERAGEVSVQIFNLAGECVGSLPETMVEAGDVTMPLSLVSLPSGMYTILITRSGGLPMAHGSFVVLQ